MDLKISVERCNELINDEHSQWIGLSNQEAIKNVLIALEEAKEKLKNYNEQIQARSNYFKGCSYCRGEKSPINLLNNICLRIKNDSLVVFDTEVSRDIWKVDIQFCPNCGKQLSEKLNNYID